MSVQPEEVAAGAGRWAPRRVMALCLRAAVLLVPVAAAVSVSALASRVIPEPVGVGLRIGWVLALSALSTAGLMLVDRQARRLLPLAALFQLSLVFPDRAPPRFRSAMRMGSVRRLEEQLELARQGGAEGESLDETAARVVELATAVRTHDRRTRGHMERVRVYADMIGEELGLTPGERDKLHWAALLHDVGKLEVPGSILNKRGRPSPAGPTSDRCRRARPERSWRAARAPTSTRTWCARSFASRWVGSGGP